MRRGQKTSAEPVALKLRRATGRLRPVALGQEACGATPAKL
jgi:hypothetical protein